MLRGQIVVTGFGFLLVVGLDSRCRGAVARGVGSWPIFGSRPIRLVSLISPLTDSVRSLRRRRCEVGPASHRARSRGYERGGAARVRSRRCSAPAIGKDAAQRDTGSGGTWNSRHSSWAVIQVAPICLSTSPGSSPINRRVPARSVSRSASQRRIRNSGSVLRRGVGVKCCGTRRRTRRWRRTPGRVGGTPITEPGRFESRSSVGADCSVDRWCLIAERGMPPLRVVVVLPVADHDAGLGR